MTTKAIDSRLAKLEVKHTGPVVVHCVAIGDGPALKVDGSECTVHHGHVFVIGGLAHASKDD